MVDYYDLGNQYVDFAVGPADLTAFDNAQAALLVGEKQAFDRIYPTESIEFTPITEVRTQVGPDMPQDTIKTSMSKEQITIPMLLQTGIPTNWICQSCSTTEATPNIHEIPESWAILQALQDPKFLAFHAEKEVTTNNRREDLMAVVPISLTVSCSEAKPIARQEFIGEYGFYDDDGGDLAAATKLSLSTYKPYTWYDYMNASAASSFLEDTNAIGLDITGFSYTLYWKGSHVWGTYDGNAYPTTAKLGKPFDFMITLTGRPKDTGTDIRALALETPGTSDIDLILDFYQSATRYHKNTFSNLRFQDRSIKNVYALGGGGQWYDALQFTLLPLGSTSTYAHYSLDGLNNDSYENPA